MGCGISKLDFEETGQAFRIRSFHRRSDDKDAKEDHDTESLTSKHRKSTSSMTSESGGFLKRVLGSNEKERGVERELEPNDHQTRRSSVSSSPRKSNASCFWQPHFETMDKETSKGTKPNKDPVGRQSDANLIEDEFIRQSNGEEYASILFSPGSPSFRVYCVDNEHFPYEDNDDENKSSKGGEKGLSETPTKRIRKGRGIRNGASKGGSTRGLRGVLQRGGSVGMKNLLNGSFRSQNSSPSHQESTSKLIAKTV